MIKIEKLSNLTVTQLLIKAKLEDKENESIYLAELDSRQPSKQELDQATDNLNRIMKSRFERANKPVSFFLKVLLIFLPFLIYNRYYNFFSEDIRSLQERGFNKKVRDIAFYSKVGLSLYILMFVTVFFIYGFTDIIDRTKSKKDDLGQMLNPMRDSLGIPPVEVGWFTRDQKGIYSIWSDFEIHSEPHHAEKLINSNNEIDRFINPISKDKRQMLEMSYNFSAARYGENPWECYLITESTNQEFNLEQIKFTKQEADSILKEWGLGY